MKLFWCAMTAVVALNALPASAKSLKGDYGACVSEDLLDQLTQAELHKDKNAWHYLLQHGCIITQGDIPVTLLDSTWDGKVKVRAYANGHAAVMWTYMENIRN